MGFSLYLVIVALIVGYFEFKYKDFKSISMAYCYELKKGTNISKGEELSSDMFVPIKMDKAKLPSDYLKTLNNIRDFAANENMFEGDILREKRIISKVKLISEDKRIIWIPSKEEETTGINDLRPGDFIDLFILTPEDNNVSVAQSKSSYVLFEDFQNLQIVSMKDKDGNQYFDMKDKTFVPESISFIMNNEKYNKLINKFKDADYKYKISIHGNRPNFDYKIQKSNEGAVNTLVK